MDRRELLKFFAIGTTIAPMVDGKPKVEAQAQLIETPIVKPVELVHGEVALEQETINTAIHAFTGRDLVTVSWADNKGKSWSFTAYMTSLEVFTDVNPVGPSRHHPYYKEYEIGNHTGVATLRLTQQPLRYWQKAAINVE